MSRAAGGLLAPLEPRARDILAEIPALVAPGRAALVGGAVRDLLRAVRRTGAAPRDLDVTLEGDAETVAHALADAWGGEAQVHGRFGTASVWTADGLRVDLAACRAERYPAPGALPEVQPAALEQDLARRDFTIHAMALVLTTQGAGPLLDPAGGRADLAAGRLRVLHEASFRDDPTRLLRASRYGTRLGLAPEPQTARWRDEALAADAAATVSGDRLWSEWGLLVGEDDVPRQLCALARDGVHRALRLPDRTEAEIAAAAQRVAAGVALRGAGIDAAEGFLAGWLAGAADDARVAALSRLAVPSAQVSWFGPPRVLQDWTDPVECRETFDRLPGAARAALCTAHGAPALAALRWYAEELRLVQPLLRGRDLMALGLAPGPRVSEVLREVFRRQLRGQVRERDEALEVARAVVEDVGEGEGGEGEGRV